MSYAICIAGVPQDFSCTASSGELAGVIGSTVEQSTVKPQISRLLVRGGFVGVGGAASLTALALIFGQQPIRLTIHIAIIGGLLLCGEKS